jgi:hypothetical protein
LQSLHFHHVGIPVPEKMPGMTYNKKLKLYSTGYFETPYGIEWMYFDEDNPLPEIIKKIPHVAYKVADLQSAIKGKKIILPPEHPVEGVTVAFVLDQDNLIELLQFDIPEDTIWPHPDKFKI